MKVFVDGSLPGGEGLRTLGEEGGRQTEGHLFSPSGADLGVFAVTGTGPLVDSAIKIDADGVLWLINNNGAVRRFRLADGRELPPAPAPWLERGGFGTAGVAVWNELPDPNRR